MKTGAGWTTAVVVALAATFGISSLQTKRPATPSSSEPESASITRTPPAISNSIGEGPCAEIADRLQSFFLLSEDEMELPKPCYPAGHQIRKGSAGLRNKAQHSRIIIATVPDPVYTHFPLWFDRSMEVIQQGAQDENYVFNSSWLPWSAGKAPSYSRIDDQDKADGRRQLREDQPGILLFRGRLASGSPFVQGLIVFIVGEEPTGGIHRSQFENAASWVSALHAPGASEEAPVQILGPSFSGSLPSLAELLEESASGSLRAAMGQELQIYSGSVTSNNSVDWFARQASHAPLDTFHLQFRSFQLDDNDILQQFCDYLVSARVQLASLAIVSEDETAYGGDVSSGLGAQAPCNPGTNKTGPVHLYYPRDISALRAAYQSQSIFSQVTSAPSEDTARRTLQDNLADPESRQHDTIRSYSGSQTALSQEAELQQIVSMMRAHQSQYILLRSSNPLDQLFLSHFFKLTYPEGRIVIGGADLLLRRETGASGLTGILTLSTYPLLPWEPDWTKASDQKTFHSHRGFPSDAAEGTYIATRFLLRASRLPAGEANSHDLPRTPASAGIAPSHYFLPPGNTEKPRLLDYDFPFWIEHKIKGSSQRPPLWLSVLGDDGFWPIAILDPSISKTPHQTSTTASMGKSIFFLFHPFAASDSTSRWPETPLSMKLCLVAVLAWSIFHCLCCVLASITAKPSHRAHFFDTWKNDTLPRVRDELDLRLHFRRSHFALLLLGSMLISVVPICLAWGMGQMADAEQPLLHPWPYRLFLPVIWLICCLALCANALVGEERSTTKSRLPVLFKPFIVFLVASVVLYWLLNSMLEGALSDCNRVPTFWRSMTLTNGVSPLVPLLALAVGLYLWGWFSLQGLALFSSGRPVLPCEDELRIAPPAIQSASEPATSGNANELKVGEPAMPPRKYTLSVLSEERARDRILRLGLPFGSKPSIVAMLCFASLLSFSFLIYDDVPIRNLGSLDYSWVFCIWLAICISILLANTWQFLQIWLRLKDLLQFLDQLPLRRSMDALKGFSWGSVWKMSGSVLEVRHKLLYREFESLLHLRNSLLLIDPLSEEKRTEEKDLNECIKQIEITQCARNEFVAWYSDNWHNPGARDAEDRLENFQRSLAKTSGAILTRLLIPFWRREHDPLNTAVDEVSHAIDTSPTYIRNAEELICLVYAGFVQNILGRMRCFVIGIMLLFISVTVSVSSYPFDPRPVLSAAVIILFLVVGAVLVAVYLQMHRDMTLSRLMNTKPGALGSDFWLKLVGLGIGPVLGLLTTVFPEFSDFLFSWLQPGLSSLK